MLIWHELSLTHNVWFQVSMIDDSGQMAADRWQISIHRNLGRTRTLNLQMGTIIPVLFSILCHLISILCFLDSVYCQAGAPNHQQPQKRSQQHKIAGLFDVAGSGGAEPDANVGLVHQYPVVIIGTV